MLIRQMRREELDLLLDWAADEGWNPGLSDADLFWAVDPEAFIAAELDGQLVGGGSIASYGGRYGFMGFFIIRPEHRGRGLGTWLWHERLRLLVQRLDEPAVIGMDGVFEMQAWYAKGGFKFSGRVLRFQGSGQNYPETGNIALLRDIPFAEIDAYDRDHFPTPRSEFLRRWIDQPGAHTRAALRDGSLAGFGVMRPCRSGYKIGPLFADDAAVADDLFCALAGQVPGVPVFLDLPENNRAALKLANLHGMEEVFGCAEMFHGPAPLLPEQEIFGVTTFEFG